ncbi:hypothetical protein E2C00_07250 [Streptomyces sp. WAC05374]|uniref:hypothetical protein n=1 Tax=Streptomyces sp. WAC05374 TaxID=2487420 RepID=UPI000F86A38C|nr:hypothetical protein [Streptomyces sp. WAC05374]RST15176.1 hypothetical protein EF905_15640 [Streptomyces sp. WAC05374]TDF45288.1 hypothetical protein E2B92_13340 [Streptomyces sp. WAC05374]TDF55724.1 hypothetical protein E2C02_14360 [Streptomyces sp. WAC05374]TDF58862.1 hypothetical protein E2C00_07250 [Streptomyces sp. WAC05374]
MNGASGWGARLMNSSITGMSPWILFSLLVGPSRYELAAALSLAVAVVLVLVRHRPIFLEIAGLVFFGVLTVIGMIAPLDTLRWLETYANEVSNLAIAALAALSVAVRAPLTTPYARRKVPREFWHTPQFRRANVVVTQVWGLAFLAAALAGAVGDLVLHNPDNLWTAWLIQASALITAMRFTEWYPAVPRPPVRSLLMPFVGLLIPMGVLVLVHDAAPRWFAVGLIVVGVILARALRKEVVVAKQEGRDS